MVIGLAIATNWVYRYEAIAVSEQMSLFGSSAEQQQPNPRGLPPRIHHRAGVPLTYRDTFEIDALPIFVQQNWLNLAVNILFWSALLGGILVYEKRTRFRPVPEPETKADHPTSTAIDSAALTDQVVGDVDGRDTESLSVPKQSLKSSKSKRKSRGILISDILIFMAVVATALGFGRLIENRRIQHLTLLDRINTKGGSCVVSAEIPSFLVPVFPQILQESFLRISEVSLQSPSDEELELLVTNCDRLRKLYIWSENDAAAPLKKLIDRNCIQELSVAGRFVDSSFFDILADAKWAQLLDLNYLETGEPIPNAVLTSCADRQFLFVNNCWTNPADIFSSSLASTLRGFQTDFSTSFNTAEKTAASDSETVSSTDLNAPLEITFESMPKLVWLTLGSENDLNLKNRVIVNLRNLPALTTSEIYRTNPIDLHISNTPQLAVLEGSDIPSAGDVAPRVANLTLAGPTQLQNLYVGGISLESVSISDNEQLTFGIGVDRELVTADQTALSLKVRQRWIEIASECGKVKGIDFGNLPLNGLDFSAWGDLSYVQDLNLYNSFLDDRQLQQIASHKFDQLQSLDLRDNYCTGRTLSTFLGNNPELKNLYVRNENIARLVAKDMPFLTGIFSHGEEYVNLVLTDVVLENMPSLLSSIDLGNEANRIKIVNCPMLEGFACYKPLPQNAELSQFRNLFFLVAGGSHVDNSIFDIAYDCRATLGYLALPFSNITSDQWAKLTDFVKLRDLNLVGTTIDDDAISQWDTSQMPLNVLLLSDTQVSTASMAALSKLTQLKVLYLQNTNVKLTADTIELLPSNLQRIDLSDIRFDPPLLTALLRRLPQLKVLHLKGCELSGEISEVFSEFLPFDFEAILLEDVKVEGKVLTTLSARPRCFTHVYAVESDFNVVDRLMSQGKISRFNPATESAMFGTNNVRNKFYSQTYPEYIGYARGTVNPYIFAPDVIEMRQNSNAMPFNGGPYNSGSFSSGSFSSGSMDLSSELEADLSAPQFSPAEEYREFTFFDYFFEMLFSLPSRLGF
jgi:predicted nuclease of predicted toxin-antitoxin system